LKKALTLENEEGDRGRIHQPLLALDAENGAGEDLHLRNGQRHVQLEINEDKRNTMKIFQWEWDFERLQKVQRIFQDTTSRPSLIEYLLLLQCVAINVELIYFKFNTKLLGEIKPKRVSDSFRLKLRQLASRGCRILRTPYTWDGQGPY
jgi:hypothetical protein